MLSTLRLFVRMNNDDSKAEHRLKLHVVERRLDAVVDVAIKQGLLKERARSNAVLFVWGHGRKLMVDADLADLANDLTFAVEAEGKPYAGRKVLKMSEVRRPRPAKEEYPFARRDKSTAPRTTPASTSLSQGDFPPETANAEPLPTFSEHARSQMNMRGICDREANDAFLRGARRSSGASCNHTAAGIVVVTSADRRTVLTCYRSTPSAGTEYSFTPCENPGIVIGRGGCVVKAIRKKTTTVITVLHDLYGKGKHCIQICGLPHSVKRAEEIVDRLMDEASREETRVWLLAACTVVVLRRSNAS
ncbi:hypothetical protein T492DRAFT_26744 [Pavlovales sp. CCMP2436]|nr:hypothetical protein T492DRAFT_26744 [Pavlovales sp. CCMP2436]